MSEPSPLPHLIELLDDESPKVRQAIARKLVSMGRAHVEAELEGLAVPAARRRKLLRLLDEQRRQDLRRDFFSFLVVDSAMEKLEAGLTQLSAYLSDLDSPHVVSRQLDELADEYRREVGEAELRRLAYFLFEEKGIRGREERYFAPEASSLADAISAGHGLPITLACLYILVGHRLGLEVAGCNFPGHFLARVFMGGRSMLVDCFHGGRFLEEDELLRRNPGAIGMLRNLVRQDLSPEQILRRVLGNLAISFEKAERVEDLVLIRGLAATLDKQAWRGPGHDGSAAFARFEPGELVRHRRYGYRGVVVARDDYCKADDDWYESNQSQPARNQAWYHVLVDGIERITYAAETSLESDASGKEVSHSLIRNFFRGFEGGRYLRNNNPWPGI